MKVISFIRNGVVGYGVVSDTGIIDCTNKLGDGIDSIKKLLYFRKLAELERFASERVHDFGWSDITLLPVIPNPEKIFCVGLNYEKHKEETKRPDVNHPTIFLRFADSQVAHDQAMIKPISSEKFDYEGEMAVIIGAGGRNISEEDALNHVAGFSCYNDGSIRDWQRHTSQFTPGKNFPRTGGFGPYLVTTDEVGDYTKLPIETRLNGKVMQRASLDELIFPVPVLISYISKFTALNCGDVIVSGTPGGVGDRREPPVYMFPGDRIEVEIGTLGILSNQIKSEFLL